MHSIEVLEAAADAFRAESIEMTASEALTVTARLEVVQRRLSARGLELVPALASGELGSHHGLPVTVVVTTTLTEIEDASGVAITGGGTWLPMRDLVRMASHAHHYLTIFGDDGRPLYLGRTKRIASADQRIVLHAK